MNTYDGYARILPDMIEDHQKHFVSEVVQGEILFPYNLIKSSPYERCYGFIKLTPEAENVTVNGGV